MTEDAERDKLLSQSSQFRSLIRRRDRLNLQLDRTRSHLDEWLQQHVNDMSATNLAMLEGLLTARREALQNLIDLDDEFITFILAFKRADAQPT